MPAFLLLALMTLLGSTTLALLVAVPGSHAFGVTLVGALTAALAGLTWTFRPTSAPEAPVEAPEEGFPLSPALRTLNADLWAAGYEAGLVVKAVAQALEPVEFHTLGSTPIWVRPCAVKSCEHLSPLGCFCVEDCDCAFHEGEREALAYDEFFGVWV